MTQLAGMMKKIQQIQSQMETLAEEMALQRFECSVGGGAVLAVVNGKGVLIDLHIKGEACDPDETIALADLIKLAVNNARSQAETHRADALKNLTGGLPLPPGLEHLMR